MRLTFLPGDVGSHQQPPMPVAAAAEPQQRTPLPPNVNTVAAAGAPSTSTRRRRDRCHNWQVAETLVLINAKRTEHFRDKNKIDPRDNMIPEVTKWTRIAQEVMAAGFSPSLRDGPSCKTKWSQILPDYKRVCDYHGRSGQNVQDFWSLSADQRKMEGLPN